MLKVECEACKAPYQVDEKRIPPTGLKMRCPKCGHAFTVQNPNAGALPVASAPPRPPPPALTGPASGPASRNTIVGVGVGQPGGPPLPVDDDMGLGDDPFAPLPAVKAVARPAAGKPPPPRPAPAAPPPALGAIDELLDLPAMPEKADLPAVVKPLPPIKPTLASRQAVAPKPKPPSLSDFDIDLPSPVADLPAARGAAKEPVVGGALSFEVDLPSPTGDLPSAKGKPRKPPPPGGRQGHADLPSPVGEVGLPAAFGSVGLPAPVSGGFGQIDLPSVGGNLPAALSPGLPMAMSPQASLPANVDQDRYLPRSAGPSGNLPAVMGSEMHLPQTQSSLPSALDALPSALDALPSALGDSHFLPSNQEALPAAFGRDSDFGAPGGPVAQPTGGGEGGVGYGELDFGSEAGGEEVATDETGPSRTSAAPASLRAPGAEAAFPTADAVPKPRDRVVIRANQSRGAKIAVVAVAALVISGGMLTFTRYGAFGSHAILDSMHKGEWTRMASDGMATARTAIGGDLFDKARGAADALANQSSALPRAQGLAAAAALTEYEFQLRYGRDGARATRVEAWLKAIEGATSTPAAVPYYSAAAGGRAGAAGDLAGARVLLDAAAQKDVGDPVQQDIALLRGEVELQAKDPKAAAAAFSKALTLAPTARAHFGLARAYALANDPVKARAELAATLAATPSHPGALVLKAELDWDLDRNETAVADGLKPVLDGPAKASASTAELSRGYTVRGALEAGRGNINDARNAFDAALKLDPRNVRALIGQGEVFYTEGRFTEALSRFDTAVQADPQNPRAIVADAKAKLALERLADAKNQLTVAQKALPQSMQVTYWLGRASEVLGDRKGAEQAYTAAIALATPADRDAVDPYVALSKLLAGQGRESEAQAKLDEARAKLPDSAPMQRALGEVAAARGLYDEAVTHYQSAISKDPRDIGARFLLGVTYRRMQRLDDASAQLDQVAAADKDYPNLAMERGLVFEQSGHVDKALAEFQSALAKAPNDLDLQLRVGAALVGIGKAEEAAKMLKGVFEKRQNSAEVSHYLGRAYFLMGGSNLIDAARYLKRAVELDPNRAEYHLYLAWVATESNPIDLGTAREEVKKALALDQLLGDAYWQRAVTEQIGGAVDDAIADAKKALQLRPTRTEAHATLARCYSDKNQNDKAMAEWSIALAQDPDRADWQYAYGKLLFDRANLAGALPHLLAAASEAEKTTPAPVWFSQSEFMLAEALRKGGKKAEAKEHYHWFLRTAQPSSPDRKDAINALKALGETYEPEK